MRGLKSLVALILLLCAVPMARSGVVQETLLIREVPAVLPRDTTLGPYSPLVVLEYANLQPGIYTLRQWLLETPNFASGSTVYNSRAVTIDNSQGNRSAGSLSEALPFDVYDYPSFRWVFRLYNSQEQEVAFAQANAEAVANRAPALALVTEQVGTAGQPLAFNLTSTDIENDPVTYTARDLPAGATLSAAGAFTWASPVEGTYTIAFRVTQSQPPTLGDAQQVILRISGTDPDGPETLGAFAPPVNLPVVPIHAALLPSRQVLFWDRHEDVFGWDGTPHLWNPATGATRKLVSPGWDLFCSGHTHMADGRLFVTNGHIADFVGDTRAARFDPRTNRWIRARAQAQGRWYPSAVLLPDRNVLVVSGTVQPGVINKIPQIYRPATNKWHDLTGASLVDFPDDPDFYPFLFVLPSGKVVMAGPQQQSRYLNVAGTGAWQPGPMRNSAFLDYASSVMYAPGKVLISGGTASRNFDLPPLADAEVADFTAPAPAWRPIAPMNYRRRHHTLVLLPTGEVLAVGGTSREGFDNREGAVLRAELWNPTTETWSLLASGARYRGYHSTALLLPDGRVAVMGGGHPNAPGGDAEPNVEMFSPPYLFQGPRPVISRAPATIRYRSRFVVRTSQAASIKEVALIRLGATTHAFDQSQRRMTLTFERRNGNLRITAPADTKVCPPGPHMLFLIDEAGVPSVAAMVQVAGN